MFQLSGFYCIKSGFETQDEEPKKVCATMLCRTGLLSYVLPYYATLCQPERS